MSLTLTELDFLASPAGERILADLAAQDLAESSTLALITRLRKDLSLEQAGAALQIARLRLKAVDKFGPDAARLFFTPDALEQASDPLARAYRARSTAGSEIIDACCGIGADSLEMARYRGRVLGLDSDPVRIAIARLNAGVLGLDARFEVADVRAGLPGMADTIFFDPARRDETGRRIYDVERYHPPLSLVRDWNAKKIVVKLSPGVDLAQLAPYSGGVEFISIDGDLKEAVLWLGADFTGPTATLLRGNSVYHWQHTGEPDVSVSEPRAWLAEPDPALLRAGLVRDVAAHFDAALIDETIAYITVDTRPESPWMRAWQVLDWMPFNLKRLRAHLRENGVGRVTVKKRGFAMTPEEIIPRLRLDGPESRTLFLTRCMGKPVVIVCADYPPDSDWTYDKTVGSG